MSLLPVDYPITTKDCDLLNRSEVVYSISSIIKNQEVSKSYTIGLIGKWGSGKTSILNLVKENLKDDPNIRFVDFSPWLYTNQENISQDFLKLMSYNLASGWRKRINKHSRHVSKFIKNASKTASLIVPNPELSKLLKDFASIISDNKDGIPLQDYKDKISKTLEKGNYRYVVIIDDLDRLRDDEILMTMKMVRSVADFSNVIYILCYDDLILNTVLKNDAYSGKEYLDKIVDISINVPEIDKNTLANMLCKSYFRITSKEALNDDEHRMIYEKILPIIQTCRDVKRLISTFYNDYNLSKNNTYPIDLLAIDLIKIKNPPAYYWIESNRHDIVKNSIYVISTVRKVETIDFKQKYVQNKLDETYIGIISELFPNFEKNQFIHITTDRTKPRISDPNYVDNYFRIASESITINESLINSFLNIKDSVELKKFIYSKNDESMIRDIIDRMVRRSYSESELDKLKNLAHSILTLNTNKDNIISTEYIKPLSDVLTIFILQSEDGSKSIDCLKKYIPEDNLRSLTFYGSIVNQLSYILKKIDEDSYSDLMNMIFDKIIKNKVQFKSLTNEEICHCLVLIKDTDEEMAKSIFIEEKDAEERKKIYNYYENSFWKDWLMDLTGEKDLQTT